MTAPALVKQSDLKRMAAIAKQEGVCVEVTKNGTIRVFPNIPAPRPQDDDQLDDEAGITP